MLHSDILKTIGNTPIVKLNRVAQGLPCEVYAKLEYFNPGGSIKDRIGYWMIEDAEKKGKLKPGGTIIEGTSGNTGVGLAIASAIKGYKCIFVLPDKMSEEKIRALRAYGAKVVVTPTAVEPEDPRSYYQVSRRLGRETPNSLYIDQYNNLSNRDCHYKTTGPEILKQMPDIDVLVAGIGTGGTIVGCGMFFREKKPSVKIVAVDPLGSIVYDKFKFKKDVPAQPYVIEGIGEDFFPENYDFSKIDDMVQVFDKESFIMTRDLLTKEGIYAGVSSGAAVVGAFRWIKEQGSALKGKKVLVIIPDSGNRYLSKVYNDDWMKEKGYYEPENLGTVDDLIHVLRLKTGQVIMAKQTDKISSVIDLMREKGISQLPVVDDEGFIKGVATEMQLMKQLIAGRVKQSDTIDAAAEASIEFVHRDTPITKVSSMITAGKIPLVMEPKDNGKPIAVLAKIDLLTYLSNR